MRLCKPQKLENGNKFLSRNMEFDATTVTLHEIYRVVVYYLQPSFIQYLLFHAIMYIETPYMICTIEQIQQKCEVNIHNYQWQLER